MAGFFPDVSKYEGAQEALNGGFYACLGFAAMNCVAIALLLFGGQLSSDGNDVTNSAGVIGGIAIELTIVLVAAWRFKSGKGLVIGIFVTLLFGIEIAGKVMDGTFSAGWVIFYVAIFLGLVNGIRGAWAVRSNSFEDEETFS